MDPEGIAESVSLRILTQLPAPDNEVLIHKQDASTTIESVKQRIQELVSSKPDPHSQRLIYRGRYLSRDTDTLQQVIGDAVSSSLAGEHVLHLVVRDTNPTATATATVPTAVNGGATVTVPAGMNPNPPAQPHLPNVVMQQPALPGFPIPFPHPHHHHHHHHHAHPMSNQQSQSQQSNNVHAHPAPAPIAPTSSGTPAAPPQLPLHHHHPPPFPVFPQMLLPQPMGHHAMNQHFAQHMANHAQHVRQLAYQLNHGPQPGRPPVPGHSNNQPVTQPNQSSARPGEMNVNLLIDPQGHVQAVLYGPQGSYVGSNQPTAADRVNSQGSALPEGLRVARETALMMDRELMHANRAVATMLREIAHASNAVAAANLTIARLNQQLNSLNHNAPAPTGVSSQAFVPNLANEYDMHQNPIPAADRGLPQGLPQDLVHGLAQGQAQVQARNRDLQQLREGDNDIFQVIAPLLRQVWLLVRLAGIIWFFSHGLGTRRTIFVGIIAAIYFVAQAGVFGAQVDRVRLYFERLLGFPAEQEQRGEREDQDGEGNEGDHRRRRRNRGIGARGRTSLRANPEAAAERLLRERQDADRGWMQERLDAVARPLVLFFASLWPGVGERHVAEQERRRREAQELADAARPAQDATETEETAQPQEDTEGAQTEAVKGNASAAMPSVATDAGEGSSTAVEPEEGEARRRGVSGDGTD